MLFVESLFVESPLSMTAKVLLALAEISTPSLLDNDFVRSGSLFVVVTFFDALLSFWVIPLAIFI